ncbi:hypothetical protein EsH8_IX_000993 [Colletotrichum jinshuiense]
MAYLQPQNPYGTPSAAIEPTQAYVQQLRSMTHRRDVLAKNGFVVNSLSDADIDDKKRCRRCNARCSNTRNRFKSDGKDGQKGTRKPFLKSAPSSQPRAKPNSALALNSDGIVSKDNDQEGKKPSKPVLKCQYHTGRVARMYWSCCRAFVSAPGCTYAPDHLTRAYTPGDLAARHQYHRTPAHALLDLSSTAAASPPARHPRRAVAIDCEMGTAYDGESELIRLTLVDYFTAEILLDSLVCPDVPMQHYNTRYSGVSRQDMDEARSKGKCIAGGLAAARAEVWRWVGPETVVVGHAVHNDLASLRWIHPLVVDSLILATAARAEREKREEEEAEEEERRKKAAAAAAVAVALQEGDLISFDELRVSTPADDEKNAGGDTAETERGKRKSGGLSLKALAAELLGRSIQKGKMGHDSLEDALAARDLVHWYVAQKCTELQAQTQGQGQVDIAGFW